MIQRCLSSSVTATKDPCLADARNDYSGTRGARSFSAWRPCPQLVGLRARGLERERHSQALSDHRNRAVNFACSLSGLGRCFTHCTTSIPRTPPRDACRRDSWPGRSVAVTRHRSSDPALTRFADLGLQVAGLQAPAACNYDFSGA
jgi:hypothetical protein